jgi:hypothetical protein
MTDKELLELAAKAVYGEHAKQMMDLGWDCYANDGDCFLLDTELGLDVQWLKDGVLIDAYEYQTYEEHGGDKGKARRYASARAAAEIGKQKE